MNSKYLQLTALATLACFAMLIIPTSKGQVAQSIPTDVPTYTATGELKRPQNYREWIFLTSGIDMSYDTTAAPTGHSTFQNVFASPSAYRTFLQTGTWPEKTMLILETRPAEGASSINKRGHTQSANIAGLEVHVKDASLEGGWGFYAFTRPDTAKLIKRPATCYQCHEAHGAVDTTFVQFYPTLLPIAESKNTLSPAYLKEKEAGTPTQK